MMPIALIEATSCSSIAGGTGVRRGLFGFGLSVRGSTLRSSVMVCSCVDRFCLPSASGDPPRPPQSRPAGQGRAGEAGPRACAGGPLRRRPSLRHRRPCFRTSLSVRFAVRCGGFSAGEPGCRIGALVCEGAGVPHIFAKLRKESTLHSLDFRRAQCAVCVKQVALRSRASTARSTSQYVWLGSPHGTHASVSSRKATLP